MGDLAETFRLMKKLNNAKKKHNYSLVSPEGWKQYTPWHWSRIVKGHRLDYWPTTLKTKFKGVYRTWPWPVLRERFELIGVVIAETDKTYYIDGEEMTRAQVDDYYN